ncbi:hypothetical protein Tcan_08201 [Toxocara canis]|uniref:Uncharacterized protein n=1 Tax=Toxocara canis TaxID=6265 RepID=A0A0B2VHN8_TOXCA|nr:hypothetical protein Tcan_08201 [Toxocara canis]
MDSGRDFPYNVRTVERYGSPHATLERGLRSLFVSFLELCFSIIVIFYGLFQGLIFRNIVNGLLFGVVGISMMQMAWLFVNGCRSNSILLLKAHAYLTLFYAIITLLICVALCFSDIFNVGIFQFIEPRIYIHSHILLGMCSLVPFIVGHRASWIRANQLRQYLIDNERLSTIA